MRARRREWSEVGLDWLLGAIQTESFRSTSVPRWLDRIRRGVGFLCFVWVGGTVLGMMAVQMVGERHWVSSLLLLLPPLVWMFGLTLVGPLALLLWRRMALLLLLPPLYLVTLYVPFHPGFRASVESADGTVFTVVSNNTGERRTRSLFPLMEEVRPDIILLQDSSFGRGSALAAAAGRPDMEIVQHAHLVTVSRFPIRQSQLIEQLAYRGTPVAARSEIEIEGRVVAVYNVHLPTPRHDFQRLRGQGFLAEMVRFGGIYSSSSRHAFREAVAERLTIARELVVLIEAEELPVLIGGDFNAPSPGYVRRLFSDRWQDAHTTAGTGWGLTFPGVSRNPLSFFGPWLRIDYVFAGSAFAVLESRVEPRQNAQHRAIVARLELIATP